MSRLANTFSAGSDPVATDEAEAAGKVSFRDVGSESLSRDSSILIDDHEAETEKRSKTKKGGQVGVSCSLFASKLFFSHRKIEKKNPLKKSST